MGELIPVQFLTYALLDGANQVENSSSLRVESINTESHFGI
jgi:hypothetical protein